MTLKRTRVAGAPKLWEPRPFRIMALDPGGTTGWASCTYPNHPNDLSLPNSPLLLSDFRFECGQIGPEEHHKNLWDFLTINVDSRSILVCESFEFRQHLNPDKAKMKVELISKEYIGLAKLFCELIDVPIYFQTASTAKNFIPDKGPQSNVKLKQLGVYKPITTHVHAMDAMRHLLYYMVFKMRIREPITNTWLGD